MMLLLLHPSHCNSTDDLNIDKNISSNNFGGPAVSNAPMRRPDNTSFGFFCSTIQVGPSISQKESFNYVISKAFFLCTPYSTH